MTAQNLAMRSATLSIDASTDAEQRARRVGIALMCGALVCFACLDTTGKYLSRHVPVLEVVWARYLGATVLVLLFVNPLTTPRMFYTRRPVLQVIRSLLLFGSTVLNFLALQKLQLAETMSVQFALPLLVSLLAGPILGEWVGARRLSAICVGFVGVLVVLKPGSGGHAQSGIRVLRGRPLLLRLL